MNGGKPPGKIYGKDNVTLRKGRQAIAQLHIPSSKGILDVQTC